MALLLSFAALKDSWFIGANEGLAMSCQLDN